MVGNIEKWSNSLEKIEKEKLYRNLKYQIR